MIFTFPTSTTITFLIGGKFSSSVEWKHEKKHFDDYELLIGLKGDLFITVNNQEFIVHQNEALLVPAKSEIQGTQFSKDIEFFWLHFTSNYCANITNNLSIDNILTLLDKESVHQIVLPEKFMLNNIPEVSVLTHQLLGSSNQDPFIFEERNMLMTHLLFKMSSNFLQDRLAFFNKKTARITHIKNWILSNMSIQIHPKQISLTFGLSPQYLSKYFKKNTGETLISYINKQKISVAKELLLRTNLSVKEITTYSYFKTEKQFFTQFKFLTGVTPSTYRNLYDPIHTNNAYIDPEIPIPKKALEIIYQYNEK